MQKLLHFVLGAERTSNQNQWNLSNVMLIVTRKLYQISKDVRLQR